MIGKIFKHEMRQVTADPAFLAATLLLIVALGFGLWNGQRWVAYQYGSIAAAEQEQAEAIARARAQAERVRAGLEKVSTWANPASTSGFMEYHLVSFASKPPAPLAPLAVGQSDLYPYVLKITTEPQSRLLSAYENANVRKLLLGPFDLAFVLIYLLPLFILALSYDVVAGEKEQGILAMLASEPLSLPALVSLKIGFRLFLVIAILIVLLTLVAGLAGARLAEPQVAMQLLAWFGITVAYSLFWFLLGVFVTSLGFGSAVNALALAGFWLIFVVLIPAVVSVWLTSAYPQPSRIECIKTLRDTQEKAWNDPEHFIEPFLIDHPGLRPQEKDDDAATWPLMERAIDQRLQKVETKFAEQLQRRQDSTERLKFLSPALLAYNAFLELTGTGIARQRDFLSQVDLYHTALGDYFIGKLLRKEFDFTGYDEFPRFHYRSPSRDGFEASLAAFMALTGQALILAVAGFPRMRRYPITA